MRAAVDPDDREEDVHDVNAPLISQDADERHNQRASITRSSQSFAGQDGGMDIDSLSSAGKVLWLLTFSAGLSGLLFGFDTGVISSTLVSIGSDLSNHPLSTVDKSVVTAVTSLAALLAAPGTGWLADAFGRRRVILFAAVLFALGALVQSAATAVGIMVAGRAAVGAAVGMASCATPLYITELAPAGIRGRLVTIQSLFITGGQVVAYCIGWFFAHFPHGWRWMVGIGAVPAIAQLALLGFMPETPRWLVQTGEERKAERVLRGLYSSLPQDRLEAVVDHVLESIRQELAEEHKMSGYEANGELHRQGGWAIASSARELLAVPGNRRSLAIACALQAIQQLCGFNVLMYFSASIFILVGFDSPIGTSLSVAGTNFVFTLVAFHFIDSVGRRKILLRSIPFMMVGLLACSVAFSFVYTAQRAHENPTPAHMAQIKESLWPTILLVSMMVYVSSYAIGLGCVPWQQSELFPLRVRSLGSGLATATNWSSNFIIGITFLPLMAALGPSLTFLIYAAMCVAGWTIIWLIYPETAGLELEGIGELLKDGWGVQKSVEDFRERKRRAWEDKQAREARENAG